MGSSLVPRSSPHGRQLRSPPVVPPPATVRGSQAVYTPPESDARGRRPGWPVTREHSAVLGDEGDLARSGVGQRGPRAAAPPRTSGGSAEGPPYHRGAGDLTCCRNADPPRAPPRVVMESVGLKPPRRLASRAKRRSNICAPADVLYPAPSVRIPVRGLPYMASGHTNKIRGFPLGVRSSRTSRPRSPPHSQRVGT